MTAPPLTLLNWLLAAAPIGVVLVLMVFFRWGGSKAGPVGWLTALLISASVFKASLSLLAFAQLEAVLLTLYVLYIIWAALLLFRVVEAAGAIEVIGRGIVNLTSDQLLQLLILAWVFSAFLQGVAGFGVPVAVVAPLLIGLGFEPILAVAGTAIGHSWSVTFGDIASSFNALIAATGLSGGTLAPTSAALLGITCLLCGVAVAHAYGRWRALARGALAIVLIGGAMAATQYLLAVSGLWNLAGFVAGMVGLVTAVATTRLPFYRGGRRENSADSSREGDLLAWAGGRGRSSRNPMPLWLAVLPYLILVVIVSAAELWAPLHDFLNQVHLTAPFPQAETGLGWSTPERMGKEISVFGHPGALLTYTAVTTMIIYLASRRLTGQDLPGILRRTVRSAVPSSIGIASMVAMAVMMDRSGMTYTLARGLASAVGQAFPLASPFIGLLGAFMTGSNTNSNVVFAPLQRTTAELLQVSALVILAAQTTGGSVGSMLAPAKVIVGCSTAGLEGQEGQVMRVTVPYGVLITAAIGVLAWILAR